MSIAAAHLKHVFGFRVGVNGAIAYQNEQTLVYPCGSNLVMYNIDQRSQKFIAGLERSRKMTAMAISPNRRYVALAETTAEDKPVIVIYDLNSMRKKKTLSAPEVISNEFACIAFSPDSKYLVGQTSNPDWLLIYWAWEKNKQLASTKLTSPASTFSVNQISFNPQDSTQICAIGNNFFKMFRYSENNLKNFGILKVEAQNFLCHTWVSDERVILGTDTGKWILVENGEIKAEQNLGATLNFDDQTKSEVGGTNAPISTQVTTIVSSSKGFAVACGLGKVHWFEKTDEKEYYRKAREIHIPVDANSADPAKSQAQIITDMCISPSEETIVACTDIHQLFTFAISSPTEITKISDHSNFDLLSYSFHYSQILGLDLCRRKPIIATCAVDRSVRIWNYETNQLELYKEFAEEAYSIALHPSGLYILVGFSDKLRLMNILIDDIRTFKEFSIRGCKECAFSYGGHYFAAVHSNLIQIYSTTSFEIVMSLKGHNGKIRNVVWTTDDKKLISCGMDGAVYEWDTSTGKRCGESVLKACSYTGISVTQDGKNTYAVGTDKTLKEISDSQVLREVESPDVQLTTVTLSNSGRMLFCGTSNGSIRSFKFPLTKPGEWTEYLGHSAQITKMKITPNDDHLVTISDDCVVMIWRVQDKEGRSVKRDKDIGWAEEILITKSDLEEKNSTMAELRTRVDELKMENEYQLRLKDMNYNEKIKELTEKFIQEMESLKTKNQVLKTEKDKEEAKHEEKLHEMMEKHSKELQDIESTNNQKLMLEYEKYQELQAKSQRMQEDYERQLQELESQKEQALEELTEYYETKQAEKSTILDNLNKDIREQTMEYEETKRLIEEDADREILDTKIKYERRLREERENNARLKGETGIMKKKFASLQKEIDDQKDEIKKFQAETQKLENVIRNLEKDKIGLKKEIQERDETIQDKEKRIYDLKKKNQELDKFKFVLDYKIKELKKQIEPREHEISSAKEQIQEMESELERFHKQNNQLALNIDELKQKLKSTEKELKIERQATRDVEAQVRRFKTDLYNCVSYIQDPKGLKESIVALYKKHIQEDVTVRTNQTSEASVDADIQKEFTRQREHLERSVASLRKKLSKDSEIHRADYVRIMQENVSLIKEINDLRRELKNCRTLIHDLEAALGLHRKQGDVARQLVATITSNKPQPLVEKELEEAGRVLEMQRALIGQLRDKIVNLETGRPVYAANHPILENNNNNAIDNGPLNRIGSASDRLPPIMADHHNDDIGADDGPLV